MNPLKVRRDQVRELEDLPNVGKAMAADLRLIGISSPGELAGRDAFALYEALCRKSGVRHDPCVLDVFLSVVAFMNGEKARPWWAFSAQRKRQLRVPG